MEAPLNYIEALLLEEIEKGRAEALLNKTPAVYYVNDRQADGSIMPLIDRMLEEGFLTIETPVAHVTYYTISSEGREALRQSLAISRNPC